MVFRRLFFARKRREQELEEEINTHLAMEERLRIERGESPHQAKANARRDFGSILRVQEVTRDTWSWTWLERLQQDFRYSVRTLLRSPGFALVTIVSLALGIGANTALFSLVDRLLIRSLPVAAPEHLVEIQRGVIAGAFFKPLAFTPADFQFVAENNPVLSDVFVFYDVDRPVVKIDGSIEPPLTVEQVSDKFFRALGLPMAIGVGESSESAAVLSYRLWQARFGGKAGAVGQTLEVNNRTYSIVGVAPSQFLGLELEVSPDIWLWTPGRPPVSGAIGGRLQPNVGIGQAQAAMETLLAEQNRQRVPDAKIQTRVTPAGRGFFIFGVNLREQYEHPLLALMALVVLVLLITCVNVGTLLLVRNSNRARELTIRVALGVGRKRLITELLIEGVILAVAGAGFAVFIAGWSVRTILSMLPASPIALQFQPDWRILAFVGAAALLSTFLFALAPAWRCSQVNLAKALNASRSGTTMARDTRTLGKLLLAGQVGLSVFLLVSAGLFLRTLWNLGHTDPGFDSDMLLQVLLDTRGSGYGPGQVGNLYASLINTITAIPDVRVAGGTRNPIMRGPMTGGDYESFEVGLGFFETLRIPLQRGRVFGPEDSARVVTIRQRGSVVEVPGVVVISEVVAKKFFPGGDPIGKPLPEPYLQHPEVVGVVRDTKLAGLHENSRPQIYVPFLPDRLDRFDAIEIRTTGDPSRISQAVQDALRRVNPKLLLGIHTMREEMSKSIMRERMIATISASFSVLGLLLACIGLFGVASYAVTQRTNELGIRMALGAREWDVIRESLRDTSIAFSSGLMVGILAAIASARFASAAISDLLFGITATDSLNIAAAGLLMVGVAIATCLIPTYRAIRVDPLVAIRYE